jgi:hypothetical protein
MAEKWPKNGRKMAENRPKKCRDEAPNSMDEKKWPKMVLTWRRKNETKIGALKTKRALWPTYSTSRNDRLAAQKSRPHAPSVPMRSAPAYFLCKWGV